jgi:hypothetical protein
LLRDRFRVFTLTSQAGRAAELRARGAVPVVANLDQPGTLRHLRGLAKQVLHLAPPPAQGRSDPRSRALTRVLQRPSPLRAARAPRPTARRHPANLAILPDVHAPRPAGVLVYASTSGVYGDRRGARVFEHAPVRPANARAVRRVAAERDMRRFGRQSGWRVSIVRIPGIYADTRLPLARLQRGTPALARQDDVFTNHIHADDLARTMVATLFRGRRQRVIHASDDTELRMGDYFDLVADHHGLPRPPRIDRAAAQQAIEPNLLSFMSESRRLSNRRLKRELRLRLRYPTVADFFGRSSSS